MLRLAALFLLTASLAHAQGLSDGPYVFHQAQGTEAVWVCDGALKAQPLPAGAPLAAPCGDVGGFALNPNPSLAPDVLPQPRRWAALSDIHGQAGVFLQLLKAQGLVDEAGHWAFADGVLVVNGDVFDRGPQQTEALWALYRLQQEAAAQGGSVQLVLGNHETMMLRGDLRYLHPKYSTVAQLFQKPFPALYGPDTELGQWLRSRATVLKLGDTLFLHGGLSPELPRHAPDLIALNAKVRSSLGLSKAALQTEPEQAWLQATQGPLWYRGYFNMPRASSAEVDALLTQFKARRIVVGHTTRPQISSLYGGRVIGIDANMKSGHGGELLLWESGQLYRGLMDGRRVALPPGDDDGRQGLADFKDE